MCRHGIIRGSIGAAALAAAAGCVPNNISLQIQGMFQAKADCTGRVDFVRGGGSVDLDWTSGWAGALEVDNNMDASEGRAGGLTVQDPDRNVYFNEFTRFTHVDLDGRGVQPLDVREASGFIVHPEASLNLVGDWVTAKLIDAMTAAIPANDLQTVTTVRVGIQFDGSTAGGTRVSSNRFVFPITFYRSGIPIPVCPSADKVAPVSKEFDGKVPCGNYGQDGIYSYCKT